MFDDEDDFDYQVVRNYEEQYSIWPVLKSLPKGWQAVGISGRKQVCLAHIKEVWTDLRPLSLRNAMMATEVGAPNSAADQSPRTEDAESTLPDA